MSRGSDLRFTDGAVAVDADLSFGDMIVTAMARFEPISMFYIAAGPHMSLNWDCPLRFPPRPSVRRITVAPW